MSNKHFGISGKGYYIALILFAAALGITGYLYYANTNRVQQVSAQEPLLETIGEIRPTQTPAPSEPPAAAEKPNEPPAVKKLQTAAPVDGEPIMEYAMDCLSYNETTRDWRVHNGMDFSAQAGTPVHAAADGTVYTVYEDDTLGHTVVIRHEGGFTTRYCSLSQDIPVNPGDTVVLGQTIGYADDTALVETAMGCHVHFCVSCQDVPMDPRDFLNLG